MKYYAVKRGRQTGIFHTWDEVQPLVQGFAGAQHKSFKSLQEAQAFLGEASPQALPLTLAAGIIVARSGASAATSSPSQRPQAQGSAAAAPTERAPVCCSVHGAPAVARVVTKNGPTFGHAFFKCSHPSEPCSFFQWRDTPPKRARDDEENCGGGGGGGAPGPSHACSAGAFSLFGPPGKRPSLAQQTKPVAAIYTDGSCAGNQNVATTACPAGWSAVVVRLGAPNAGPLGAAASVKGVAAAAAAARPDEVLCELFGPVPTPASVARDPGLAAFYCGAEVGSNNTGELCGVLEALLWLGSAHGRAALGTGSGGGNESGGGSGGGGSGGGGSDGGGGGGCRVVAVEIRYDSEYAAKTVTGQYRAVKNVALVASAQRALRAATAAHPEYLQASAVLPRSGGISDGGGSARCAGSSGSSSSTSASTSGGSGCKGGEGGGRVRFEVRFVHVKGHSGDRFNDVADGLAKRGAAGEACRAGRWATYARGEPAASGGAERLATLRRE